LEIFLEKIEGKEVVDVCRVTMLKVEDFDKPKIIVQVDIRKLGVKDVLLDGGSRVNIIFKELIKKLGLRRPQSTPCMVHATNQRKPHVVENRSSKVFTQNLNHNTNYGRRK
jgi:hypothetical protein